MIKDDTTLYQKALKKFGCRHQMILAIEELAELQVELAKVINGRTDVEALVTEIADVEIMLSQLIEMHHLQHAVAAEKLRKLQRLEKRLQED